MKTRSSFPGGKSLSRTQRPAGLTRLEVLGILASVALLASTALPLLASHGERSARLVCFSNLRQVGQGLLEWGTDHENRVPWRKPWCAGGTTIPISTDQACFATPPFWFTGGLQHNNWFQWWFLSNRLDSPRILACPADTPKRQAVDWSLSANGGFLHGAYRNNAVRYFVGLDTLPENPMSLVAGDSNLRFSLSTGGGCSSGIRYNAYFFISQDSTTAQVPGAHGEAGNFLFLDGRVEELSSRTAAKRFQSLAQDSGAF